MFALVRDRLDDIDDLLLQDILRERRLDDRRGCAIVRAAFQTPDYCRVGVDLSAPGFTPPLLLRLIRLAYQHVRIGDDAHHEGHYSPDTRDVAERGRNAILSALLATTGPEGRAFPRNGAPQQQSRRGQIAT